MATKSNTDQFNEYPVRIKQAINYYNANRKTSAKMTMNSLAEVVFKDSGNQVDTNRQMLSCWNNGKRIEDCKTKHCLIISRVTGYPLTELLSNYID